MILEPRGHDALVGALLAWWVASRVLRLPSFQVGAVVCCVLSVNTGYLGYPLTVALLAAIESLLSAVVADSMSGDKHNPSVELVAQGIANLASPFFVIINDENAMHAG